MCAKWIWYPGDFELYHNLVLHSRREKYDYAYPVMWHIERPQSSCCFSRQITLQEASEIIVYAHGKGYVRAGNQKIGAVGKPLRLPAGTYVLSAEVVCLETFPEEFCTGRDRRSLCPKISGFRSDKHKKTENILKTMTGEFLPRL